MKHDIVLYGDSRLMIPCQDVTEMTEEIASIIRDMNRLLINKNAVGIAAPQVGEALNIIILSPKVYGWDSAKKRPIGLLINPTYTVEGTRQLIITEGCLSLPGIREEITRPDKIIVKAMDFMFEPLEFISEGLQSRVIQHEYDHLIGKTMLDYLTPERLDFNKNQLKRISKAVKRSKNATL